MKKEIKTNKSPEALGPYSQALKTDSFIFVSGQIPFNTDLELVSEDVEEQAHQCLKNLRGIVEDSGCSMDQVVKTTVFIKDMNNFESVNNVYSEYFTQPYPARSCIEVARLPKDVKVEIEAIVQP